MILTEATKFSHYLLESTKRYQTTVFLGHSTTTGDVEGEVLLEQAVPELTEEHIQAVLAQFTGEIQQVPPMYSALYMSLHVKALKLNVNHDLLVFMPLNCSALMPIVLP